MSLFKRYYPVLVAVLVAVLPLGMNTYWTEVAVNVGLYALLALSLNVILGQAGIFHMGHAAFYAVGAYVTAILNTHYQIPILLLGRRRRCSRWSWPGPSSTCAATTCSS